MALPKPDPALADLLDDAASAWPDLERRRMFGCPVWFVNGQMTAGVFGDRVFVRLAPADRAAALARPGFVPFTPMEGRTMREYALLAPADAEDPASLRGWVARALGFTRTLPAKARKRR